jgi:hypothetical protein
MFEAEDFVYYLRVVFQLYLLSSNVNRRILILRLQNQATELELRLSILATIFYCRASRYTSMVGWARAP